MYNERPTTIVEKRVYEETGSGGGRGNDYGRSTRERANAGLGFGIAGTVLGAAALFGRGGGIVGGLLGGGSGSSGGGSPANVNINGVPASAGGATYIVGGCGRSCPTAFEAYEKSCDDAIALTNAFWRLRESGILEAQSARNTDVQEKFGLYSALVNQGFNLYKEGRDNLDMGGVLGLAITVTVMLSIKDLKPTVAVSVILIAQLLIAALIEAFGWMGQEKTALGLKQFLGLGLMLGGVVLFKLR